MLTPRLVAGMFSAGMMVLWAVGSSAQSTSTASEQAASTGSGQAASTGSGQAYPNKPVRLVTAGPSGGGDFAARVVAQGLTGSLGQQVIVDNRPPGIIPGQIVSRSLPDGYTLLASTNIVWIGPFMRETPYDPVRDFAPIALVTAQPNVLVVHPSSPVKSVKELIALAKARPGELNYAASAIGTASHLAGELFKVMSGVNIVCINYKGPGASLIDLIAGEVQLSFPSVPAATPHLKSGKLRALAVGSAEPSALAPGLPTIAESGVPGYEVSNMIGVLAPAKTPVAIINRLNQEIVRYLRMAEVKERFLNSGVETVGSSPEQFSAKIKAEMIRMGKVIKDAGIRAE